jgi:twitching motility protein PilJ
MNAKTEANRWALIAPVLAGLAALGVLVAGALTVVGGGGSRGADAGPTLVLALRGLPLEARAAMNGDAASFDALAAEFRRASAARRAAGGGSEADWRALTAAVAAVESARPAVQTIGAAARQVRERAPRLLSRLGDLASTGGTGPLAGVGAHLDRFELTVQRIQLDVDALATGVGRAGPTAQRLADGLEALDTIGRGLTVGRARQSAAAGADAEAVAAFVRSNGRFSAAVRTVIGAAAPIAKAQSAAATLARSADALAGRAEPVRGAGGGFGVQRIAALVALATALGCLAALVWVYRKAVDRRREAEMRARENDRNQDAIMRLLDELSNLADGDLTVQATVTEDITGAIADSINYAIEALRELVTTINAGAIQLDGATKQAQAAAAHMAKASAAQSRQISAASESVAEMAASIEEVSGNAERCSDVARHSVDIAHKGGDAVRRTIDGMNAIRETIQETSKRIKRLGESSQEIGNIVELINDIAEQTNILALNASIQASMAGEAGRGFAVVADEVQRLAERAANATKQIEVLVRTIQTDTNEAVVSMERSTTDVVGGALLAENAGAALEEIEQVSNQIASLVQNISASARQQAAASGNISKNMQVLREISSQTADGSSATSASVSKLAALAAQLRKSVAGFRLADAGATTVVGSSSTRLPALKEPVATTGDARAPDAGAAAVDGTGRIHKTRGFGT